jgi:hypothetical protein
VGTSNKKKIHRREFVRQGATATLAATTLFGSGLSNAFATKGEYKLKSEAQFKNEAAQYTSAIREIRKVSQLKTDVDLIKATAIIEQAAPALKFQLSSFVVMCLSNASLVNAVKKRIPNQAALDSFIDAGLKDLNVFLELDGVKALQAQMLQTSLEHREVLLKAAEQMGTVGETETPSKAAKRAQEDQECARIWAIVAAVVLIVVAIVVLVIASIGSPFTGGSSLALVEFVAHLAQKHGPNLSDIVIERGQGLADSRYSRCVASARRLPLAERARAIARCQALWLHEKSDWLIAA